MFAKLRNALAGPAGVRLVLPVLVIAWGVQRLADLAAELELAIEQKADELARLEGDLAARATFAGQVPYPAPDDTDPLGRAATDDTPED